jgi:hypothetical protein
MEWLAEIFPFLYQFLLKEELHRFMLNLQTYGDKFESKFLFIYGALRMNNQNYFKALREINLKYEILTLNKGLEPDLKPAASNTFQKR